jgi:regulator of replication initiation timing
MIAKERKLNGVSVGHQFEKELDNIIDENTDLKIENKRLKKIIGGL